MTNIELEDYDNMVNREQRRFILGALGIVASVIVLAFVILVCGLFAIGHCEPTNGQAQTVEKVKARKALGIVGIIISAPSEK